MSKSPWGNIGAWAAEAERADAEEREAAEKAAAAAAAQPPPPSFPSLKEAVSTTTKQKKKTKMSLQEFTLQSSTYSGSAPSRGLTPEEMLRLPTGPKERSPDEMQHGRLGGGFSSYGPRTGSDGPNQGRRSYGFDDDNRRGQMPRVSEPDQPSRADGVDNWGSMKRQPQTLADHNSGLARTGPKYGSLGGGGGPGISSRADEVDNWASLKKPVSQPPLQQSRSSSFGSGFARPESDRWTKNEPPKSEVDVVVKVNKPNPFGAARPREEVLAEKGLDWKKLDSDIDEKKQLMVSGGSRPTSSQSSRPETPHSSRSEVVAVSEDAAKQKPKLNPFGDAKPREVLLEEKGLDWKKIDLELENRRVERSETEEEKNLKEEIEHLKQELLQKSGDELTSTHDLIHKREEELDVLVNQLDAKVRYTQKNYERQGSGVSRGSDRPPSRPGAYEEPRPGSRDRHPSRHVAYENPRAGFNDRPNSTPGLYEDPRAGYTGRPNSRPGIYEDPRSGYEDPRQNFHDRPRSRPGAYEDPRGGFAQRSFTAGAYQEPRAGDYNERPHSRGTVNSWARSPEDRSVQSGGGRGFLGSRDVDRSGSRW